MRLNKELFTSSQSIRADLKRSKENINCTMFDLHGDVFGPPHGQTPVAAFSVKSHKEFLKEQRNHL